MFNEDVENPFPPEVVALRAKVAAADALLIATPEYNSSISGCLKNAIDWLSRSPKQPLARKPAAIMGASTGNFGTARAQLHLRQVLAHVGALPLGKPDVLVARAEITFDAEGNLVDEAARVYLRQLLEALVAWTHLVGRP
jgi:chromate reductase